MISLLIKGNVEQAKEAAAKRNIPLLRPYANLNGHNDTHAETNEDQYVSVIEWFCEDDKCKIGVGYPAGTLLHYNKR